MATAAGRGQRAAEAFVSDAARTAESNPAGAAVSTSVSDSPAPRGPPGQSRSSGVRRRVQPLGLNLGQAFDRPRKANANAHYRSGRHNDTRFSLLLSRKEIRNKTEEEKRAYMYQIVFPEDGATSNPYELYLSSPGVCH